jgi:anti-sigma regulatory factor (Ser/Thr protein kinase)
MNEHESGALATRSVRLPADRNHYTELVNVVEAFGRDTEIEQRSGWHEFLTAVSEIGANVLTYAYEDGEPGDVDLKLLLFPDCVEAHFHDWGAPFVEEPAVSQAGSDDLLDPIAALLEGGRGLAIARLALDSVRYERHADRTNSWELVKTLLPN